MNFLRELLSSNEAEADSIVVLGVLAGVALMAFTGMAVFHDPASFNPINFGGSITALLAGIGGGRKLRDGGSSNG